MESVFFVVALGAVLAGFVQGLSGFGFGLTAVSIWVWFLDPRLVAVLIVFGSLTGQILAAVTVRRGVDWRVLLPFIVGGLLGVPLGVWLLPRLDVDTFRAALGILLALWCPLMLLSDRIPRIRRGGSLADGAVGLAGGIMGGIGGFSGVLPTLWCTLRGFAKDTQRGVIQNFNLALLLVTAAGYLIAGVVTAPMLPYLAVVLPAMLAPTLIGTRVYAGISEKRFRQVVLGLLTLSGIAMLASSLPKLIATQG